MVRMLPLERTSRKTSTLLCAPSRSDLSRSLCRSKRDRQVHCPKERARSRWNANEHPAEMIANLPDIGCLQIAQQHDDHAVFWVEPIRGAKSVNSAPMIDQPVIGFIGNKPSIPIAYIRGERAASCRAGDIWCEHCVHRLLGD